MGGGYTGNRVTRLFPPLGASIIAREVGEFLLFVNIVLPIFPLLAAVFLNFTNTFCWLKIDSKANLRITDPNMLEIMWGFVILYYCTTVLYAKPFTRFKPTKEFCHTVC